ncbi:MAG: hypothetical protein AB9891_06725 [Anaerolineaceae bacterium]
MTNIYDQISAIQADYQAKIEKAKQNNDLSPDGRRKAIKSLTDEKNTLGKERSD